MSLFPAYNQDDSVPKTQEPKSWLSNPSFTSSVSSSRPPPSTSSSDSSSEDDRHSSRRRRRKKEKKSRRRRRRRSSSSSSSSSSDISISREEIIAECNKNKTFIEETGLTPEFAFRLDPSGSKSLLKAKELPLKPLYHSSTPRRRKNSESPRFFEKKYLKKFIKSVPPLLKPSMTFGTAEYIRFNAPNKPPINADNPLGIYDISTTQYLSGKPNELPEEPDTLDIVLNEAQKRTKEFNEHLREHPQDINSWLAYVDFQDEAYEATSHIEESANKKDKKKVHHKVIRSKAIVEKKLSILQTALDKNPKSSRLAVKRLDISKEILDTSTLNRQWKEVLYLFPHDFALWKEYLMFKISHFTSFKVNATLNVFKSIFKKILDLSENMNRPSNLEDIFLEFFAFLVYFLRLSGFGEKSTSLCQAQVEFNWFTPPIPGSYSIDDRLALFEPFWESGLPRFGEDNALGWSTTRQNKTFSNEGHQNPSTEWEDDLLTKAGARRPNMWLAIELGRTQKNWIPWRRSNEGDDEVEDPDRMVSFEDISPFLFNLVAQESKVKLLFIFLQYLIGVDDVSHFNRETSFLGTGFTPNTLPIDFDWLPIQKMDPQVFKDPFFNAFVRNVFSQILGTIKDKTLRMQLAILWIRFEANSIVETEDPTARKGEAKALIQKFLADNPTDVNLYLAYADFVLKTGGGYKSASKVLKKCLEASSGFDPYAYHAGIELELSQIPVHGDIGPALWLLILSASDEKYRKRTEEEKDLDVLILVAKRKIAQKLTPSSQAFKSHPIRPEYSGAIDRVFVYLWLVYFSEGITLFERASELCESLSEDINHREFILKFRVQIYEMECARKGDKFILKTLRKVLLRGIREYPRSSFFLDCVMRHEAVVNSCSPLWQFILSSESPSLILQAAQCLIQKFKAAMYADTGASGLLNKAANLLTRSIQQCEDARRSPAVWRLLFWITHTQNALGSTADLHTLFYRSVQECPGAKALYLDVIYYTICDVTDAPESEANDKLRSFLNLIAEKEIRLRMPIEELDVLLEAEPDESDLRLE